MKCCKAEEFGWCKDLPVVKRITGEGAFCLFHAPANMKDISVEEFNESVFKRIRETKEDTHCNLSGTVFPGPISFEQFTEEEPLPAISFAKAQFNGNVLFTRPENVRKFEGLQEDFPASVFFGGNVDFQNAEFIQDAFFTAAIFSGAAEFAEAEFKGEQNSFSSVTFQGKAYFIQATFEGETRFVKAVFTAADFRKAEFKGKVFFSGASFTERVLFESTRFNNYVNLCLAIFSGTAWFVNLHFGDDTEFVATEFLGSATFYKCRFSGHSIFVGRVFEYITNFDGILIEGGKLHFEGTNLAAVIFRNVDFTNIEFVRPLWREEYGRRILYDEAVAFKAKDITVCGLEILERKVRSFFKPSELEQLEYARISYNKLKQKYKREHNEAEASVWHHSEKEMQRKMSSIRNPFQFIMLNLYWLSSGYAEAPLKAFIVLLALIAGFSLLLISAGLVPQEGIAYNATAIHGLASVGGIKGFLAVSYSVLQYATFQKQPFLIPAKADLWGWYLKLFCQIFLPVQTALLVLAIRNRFRR
jgi:uncharacterized protein YjbI with pentapeptide repeats